MIDTTTPQEVKHHLDRLCVKKDFHNLLGEQPGNL